MKWFAVLCVAACSHSPAPPPRICAGPSAAPVQMPPIVTAAHLRHGYEDAIEAWKRADAGRRDCADKLAALAAWADGRR